MNLEYFGKSIYFISIIFFWELQYPLIIDGVKYIQEPSLEGITPKTVREKAGDTLVLPCDVNPPAGDRVALILWYRDNIKEAIYTFDARNANDSRQQQHTPHEPSLQSRATFHPYPPANLTIHNARPADAGVYQCRVDFITALSKTTYIQVRVMAPPKSIHLEDAKGTPINDIIAANLKENLTLYCVVLGGEPHPYIWWTVNGEVIDGEKIIIRGMRTQSQITIRDLTRRHHDTSIGCQGSAPNSSIILAENTMLKINTPPSKVWLDGIPPTLVADQKYRLNCGVSGVYPSPEIKWTISGRDGLPQRLGKEYLTGVSNNDIYWIEYEVQASDNGAQLNCSASSPVLPKIKSEDSTYLTVHYAPRLTIGLGEHLSPTSIKEGMDVYFKCFIGANPKVYKVSWFHGEEEIKQKKGILVSDDHLVIQKVTREWTGEFTCRASNVAGDSTSNKLNVTVQFPPVCADDSLGMFEVSLGEEIFLPCRVFAHPSNVSFYWTFASAATQVARLSQEFVRSKGLESILRYRLETPQDYGSLQCWAINVAGEQQEACTVALKPAGAPSPPTNCSVSNQTWDSLEISCYPPKVHFSPLYEERAEIFEIFEKFGNLTKTAYRRLWRDPIDVQYLLTIYEQQSLRMVHNETGSSGIFLIRELSPGLDYLITISRFNDRGRSSEITLEAFTLKTAENRMSVFSGGDELVQKSPPQPKPPLFPPLTVVLIGSAVTLLAITLLLGILIKSKCRRQPEILPKGTVSLSSLGDPPDLLEKKTGDFSPSTTTLTHSSMGHEMSGTTCDGSQMCLASLESRLDSGYQAMQTQIISTQSSHQIPILISQIPPPPESFINPSYIAYQTETSLIAMPSRVQCQCIKIPTSNSDMILMGSTSASSPSHLQCLSTMKPEIL